LSAALTAEEAMDSSLDMTGLFAPKEDVLPRPAVLPNFPFGTRPEKHNRQEYTQRKLTVQAILQVHSSDAQSSICVCSCSN